MAKKLALAAVKQMIDEAIANEDKSFECVMEPFGDLPKKFYKAIDLEVVVLRENNLASISEKNLLKMANLSMLEISKNLLATFPSALKDLADLKIMDLSENKISKIPKEIGEFKSLEELNLSNNPISSVNKNISECPNLTVLDLSFSKLKSFPIDVCSIPSLLHLRYNGNGLSVIPSQVTGIVRLTELRISQNKLNNIEGIGSMVNLIELDVSSNKISSVPTDIGYLTQLKTLNLGDNLISELPMELFNANSLEFLNLSRNSLAAVPSQLGEMENMLELNISRNNITIFPASVGKMTKLRSLDVHENALDHIPPEVVHCEKLEFFDLSGNPDMKKPGENIRREGVEAIMAYFRGEVKASAEFSEVKADDTLTYSAGEVGTFEIIARDSLGVERKSGGDRFKVILSRVAEDDDDMTMELEGAVDSDKKGKNTARFYTKLAGLYIVSVRMGGKNLRASPFKVTVLPGIATADSTVAAGPGLVRTTVGLPGEFTVYVKDKSGNDVSGEPEGGLAISIVGRQGIMDVNIRNNHNGTYTVTWAPITAGIYVIVIKLGEDHIQGSPFKCQAVESIS